MIWDAISGIFGEGLGMVRDHFQHKRKLKEAEIENKARLLRDTQSNNHEWEMANLQDKDVWLRRISFVMFTGPFIWVGVDPVAAESYFQTLNTHLPEWYRQTYMGITGGIWGISSLKNAVPGIVQGVMSTVKK